MMKDINLTWKADGIIDSYTIYRSEDESIDVNNLPPPLIAGVTVKGYTDNYVGDATSLHYRVASVKGDRSKISEEYVVELGQTTEISCDGARDRASFDSLGLGYNIVLNGVLHDTSSNLPYYIRENLSSILGISSNNGYCRISNLTQEFQRIELIPTSGDMVEPIISNGSNTLVHVDMQTGIITFCLSPYELS